MYPFEYSKPTKVIFGEGRINEIGREAAAFGKKAFLLSFNETNVKKYGYFDKVKNSLESAGVEFTSYFGVKSNPTNEHALPIIKDAKKEKPDVIIALGGGSVMDESKYIAAAAKYDGDDPWDLVTGEAEITDAIPVITIVTIPATSSELNGTSVMSNEKLKRKDGFGSEHMLPKVSILDPELTYTVPINRTAYSAADIISHLLEHYLGHNLEWAPFQDHYSQASIKTIMECMEKLLVDSKHKEARAQMMWCAALAWSGFYDLGLGDCYSTIHVLGHSLSNFYDTPHGAAMSVTILATMRHYINKRTKRYADFAREVFDVNERDDKSAALRGIYLLEQFFKRIGTPTTLEEAGISEADAAEIMTPDAYQTAVAWGEKDNYTKPEIREMFELCKE